LHWIIRKTLSCGHDVDTTIRLREPPGREHSVLCPRALSGKKQWWRTGFSVPGHLHSLQTWSLSPLEEPLPLCGLQQD
jgi:hypothetical protein